MVHYEHDKCDRNANSADKSHAKQLRPSQQNWNESVKRELKYGYGVSTSTAFLSYTSDREETHNFDVTSREVIWTSISHQGTLTYLEGKIHKAKTHVSVQIGLLVLLVWTVIDFINAFRGANSPRQTVKGAYSVAGDVTSASANLEKQTSHDSTQLLAFSCGVLKTFFQSSQGRDEEARGSYWHILQLLDI